ncbi:Y-family DNA polymerase [Clostridium sp. Marseille-P299]|uniref:Y-family DNA polymerase n=1 Tax=Clostridium sp. Marseille-P299 TaxID=1805477 RepID=UPI00083593D2|nr:DNA polymerase IV [Clostridium sp. Marseille-P299]
MSESLIFHIDVNSAFLSWEAAYRLHILGEKVDLREIPAVVGGDKEQRHGIVLAKSISAKKYNIHTGEALVSALRKCPDLVVVPPNYEMYVGASKAFISILSEISPKVEQYSIDEAFIDMSGTNLLYGSPIILANNLRERIKQELNFTVNIGVSSNKLLAKMAGDLKKPDLVHTMYPDEIEKKMWPLPVADLFYIGRATERKLYSLGIRTIGELAKTDVSILRDHLGKHGEVLYQYSHGVDSSPFLSQPIANKGYGNSVTTPCDVVSREHAKMVILSLCETVGMRLRKDGVKGSCISVSMKDYTFFYKSHQGNLYSPTNTTLEIYHFACKLFDELWDGVTPLRQLGVHVGKITGEAYRQYNIFDKTRYEKLEKLDSAIDEIRTRFGEDSIMRASFINSPGYHMAGGISKDKRGGITKPI